jgi:hypothetical protein
MISETQEQPVKFCPEWSKILGVKTECLKENCTKYKTYYIATDLNKPEEQVEFSLCLDSMKVEVLKVISSEIIKFNETFNKMVEIDEMLSGIEEKQNVEEENVEASLYG